MKDAYILDVWETLADTPEWQVMLEKDPELRALSEKAKTDVPSKRELVRKFDEAVQGGKLTIVQVPGARSVLERLASKGHLVAFSSGSNYTNQALLEGAKLKGYFNPLLITSDADTLQVSKGESVAYVRLADALKGLGLSPELFVDNTQRNVVAATNSGGRIPSLYHFDRTASGLLVPEQKPGYVRIGKLEQIEQLRELRR